MGGERGEGGGHTCITEEGTPVHPAAGARRGSLQLNQG